MGLDRTIGGGVEPVHLDDFECVAGHGFQLIEVVVVETRVRRAADVPIAAVVGEDHAVFLEGGGDDERRSR